MTYSTKKLCLALLCLLVLVLLVPATALAVDPYDGEPSLTISYQDGSTPLSNVNFDIYLVATIDKDMQFTLMEDFDYPIDLKDLNQNEWSDLALTLKGYVLRDGLKPYDSGKTDKNGELVFPQKKKSLEPGLYLVIGDNGRVGVKEYFAAPFLTVLPCLNEDFSEWEYDVTASPKHVSPLSPKDETIKRKVLKVWDDEGHEAERPSSITVELLCDGNHYDSVILSEENNWRYTWDDLNKNHEWLVVEKEQSGYTAKVHQEGVTFVVTNSYNPPTPPGPPTPPTPPEPPTPPTPHTPSTPHLPQTGLLWWPVPFMTALGLGLIIVGCLRRRNVNEEA